MQNTRLSKRRDKNRIVLKTGEGLRKNGSYYFRWRTRQGERECVYAKTLEELREKEETIKKDKYDGIKAEGKYITVNDLYDLWKDLKRGLKDNTFQNYQYTYNTFVRPNFGKLRIKDLKKSDVKRFYNNLVDERNLQISSVDCIHTVLHQILQIAVDDEYIRHNPSDNVLTELKKSHVCQTEKRRGLTKQEQDLLLNYLMHTPKYYHWYPLIAVMIGTGLRVGEVTGLRWKDIDLKQGTINVNNTLVYYCHREDGAKNGCYFNVNTPKTAQSNRIVPMLGFVKEAFILEKKLQNEAGLKCNVNIDGYTDFIFINRFGDAQHQGTINKAIRRIIRDCNDAELNKNPDAEVLLPHFSCHSLRHTFTTRMCEAGINVKVIQSILGHKDITTTLDIYTDVTKDMMQSGVESLEKYMIG